MILNKNFYPTPDPVIKKMTVGLDLKHKTILEPSAGSGHIVDYLTTKHYMGSRGYLINPGSYSTYVSKNQIYCMEIEPDLRFVLQGKNYRVLAQDFLKYAGDYIFDIIIMNPPFDAADKHLLKAWDIVAPGGEIRCLLNIETINNPYSEIRKYLATVIEAHGSVEPVGQVFIDAERRTSVDCAIVTLKKPVAETRFDFSFKRVTSEAGLNFTDETLNNKVAVNDVIGNMVAQYGAAKEAMVEYMRAVSRMHFYGEGLTRNIVELADSASGDTRSERFNNFTDALRADAWDRILSKTKVEQYMTAAVRADFKQNYKAQGFMDLTKENIYELVAMIFNNRDVIMDAAIIAVFDKFTSHHKDNRYLIEGWKTNDRWKVNRKVILPNFVSYGSYTNAHDLKEYGDTFSTTHYSSYDDIDKVMCYITGQKLDSILSIERALSNHFNMIGRVRTGDTIISTLSSTFFNIKFFRKGTVHLEFKDTFLWQEFNMRATAGKKWLPAAEEQAWRDTAETKFVPAGLLG